MLTFKNLSLLDRDIYLRLFSEFPPYADLFFNNLFTWLSQKQEVQWAHYNEAIIIRFIDPFSDNSNMSYTFLAKDSADHILHELMTSYDAKDFLMIPAVSVSHLKLSTLSRFTVTRDQDNSDYVYSASELAFMTGAKSKGFLRQVNYFLKNHSSEALPIELDLTRPEHIMRLVNTIHQWDVLYTHNDSERQEARALEVYIREATCLQPRCMTVVVNGKIEAFSFYAYPPQRDYIILSHAKSSYTYKGLFDFLIYCTISRAIADHGVQYINFEQDLGIEGLRRHKESMRPIKRLDKYTLIRNIS